MDITYTSDKMFTRFYPNSLQGESVWREMASKMNGVVAVFNFEAKAIIAQMKAAGYKVGKEKPIRISDDELLELLGA